MKYLAIFIGGGLGSLCRFLLANLNPGTVHNLPWGTIVANIISCIILGFAVAFFSDKDMGSSAWRALIVVGFCGGFSTFSTFSLESFQLLKNQAFLGFLNIIGSVIVCLIAIYVGFYLHRFLVE